MIHCLRMFKILGVHTILLVIIQAYDCSITVTMEVSINVNYMTLSCLVGGRDIRKNIYLRCPLIANPLTCRENCQNHCPEENCDLDRFIECRDQGLDTNTGLYQIDYIIDALKAVNHGKWWCQYGGKSSDMVYVNASSLTLAPRYTTSSLRPTFKALITKSNTTKVSFTTLTSSTASSTKQTVTKSNELNPYIQYDKVLTKSEFVAVVIGFLVLSVLFNVYFCCRLAFVHCHFKEKSSQSNLALPNHVNNTLFNHSSSQVMDSERIYEAPQIDNAHIPLQTTSGNYVMSSYSSHNYAAPATCISHSTSSGKRSTSRNSPAVPNHLQSNYFTDNYPKENNYSNLQAVQPQTIDQGNNASFPVNIRPCQYNGDSTLHSHASMPSEQRISPRMPGTSSTTAPFFCNTISYKGPHTVSMTNYQLSREMMEEADNLLRTADTLLRSANISPNSY